MHSEGAANNRQVLLVPNECRCLSTSWGFDSRQSDCWRTSNHGSYEGAGSLDPSSGGLSRVSHGLSLCAADIAFICCFSFGAVYFGSLKVSSH
jgi:hypothetical protein